MERIRALAVLIGAAFMLAAPAHPIVPASPLESTDLTALRGRVVYLDFWASWCAPCRQSFPWMQTLEDAYKGRGLTIIAVNLDRDRSDAESFLKKYQPRFEVRFDPQGHWAEAFKVQGMPTSVMIDRAGNARFTHVGFRPADGSRYVQQIEQLLAEHP